MSYTLIGSQRSPFVRACRLLMIQNNIDFEFRILNFVDSQEDARVLEKESPINRVPILIDGGQRVFDSRIIANYLTQKHHLRQLSVEEENYLSSIYSCLDTGVILFLMKRDGFDMNSSGFFLSRQRQRIPDNLAYLEQWVKHLKSDETQDWSFVSMSLYSFLYWADKRELMSLGDYPEMNAFVERFKNSPGISSTGF